MSTDETSFGWAWWILAITALICGVLLIAWLLRGYPDQTVTVPLDMKGQKKEALSDGLLLYVKGDGGAVSLTVVPKDAADSPQFCNKNLVRWDRDGEETIFALSILAPKLGEHYPIPRHIPICGYPFELIAKVKDPRFHKLKFAGGSLVITIKHVDETVDQRNYMPTD